MSALQELIKKIEGMDPETLKQLDEAILSDPEFGLKWSPNAGPQYEAFNSLADLLLYGGQAGGGKSGLIIGLALTRHKRSLLMRRQYNDLGALIDDCLEKYGTRQGFSGQPPARLKTHDDRLLEFGAAKMPGDEEHWKGQPHDLICIDEASQFLESQVRFLMGWLRSTDPNQRCRVLLATNPPEKPAEGQYLVKMFAPWLDPQHELHPTPNGVLRWVVTDEDGNDKWVDGPGEVMILGRLVKPTSRTFIPAALADNPFLARTEYGARLDALPEPLRSAIRDGNWMIAHEDDPFQVIPTNWVIAAQERWTRDPPDAPMCAMGVDVAQGGSHCTVIAPRYDTWFGELVAVPGNETPYGSDVAALVIKHRRNRAYVAIDMGGGYGGGAYEFLRDNIEPERVIGYKGADSVASRTQDRLLPFANRRAESYWRLREALDPDQEGGSPIMLPPDSELAADLVSVRRLPIEDARNKIQLEKKEDQAKRLGRSPDKGDAVVMAWAIGDKYLTHGQIWRDVVKAKTSHRVFHGHENRKRRWR